MGTDREVIHVWGVNAECTRWEYTDRARARDRYLNEVVISTENGWEDTVTLYEAERVLHELGDQEADRGMWILASDPRVETVLATANTPTLGE